MQQPKRCVLVPCPERYSIVMIHIKLNNNQRSMHFCKVFTRNSTTDDEIPIVPNGFESTNGRYILNSFGQVFIVSKHIMGLIVLGYSTNTSVGHLPAILHWHLFILILQ